MCFVMKIVWFALLMYQIKILKFYGFIVNRYMCNETKNNNKKIFCKCCF